MGKLTTVIVTAAAFLTAASLFYVQSDKATQPGVSLQAHSHFAKFVVEHSKVYDTPAEKNFRLRVFTENLDKIEKIRQRVSHRVGVNKFADMTQIEFKKAYTGYKPMPASLRNEKILYTPSSGLGANPSKVDWSKGNTISPPKNQKTCGGCWAFSALATLEHAATVLSRKTNPQANYVSLSEQHLIDCDQQNGGCEGGHFAAAFDYLIYDSSAKKESDYKYKNKKGSCKGNKYADVLRVDKYFAVKKNNMKQLENAVAKGVVSIAVEADEDLQYYEGGIMDIMNYDFQPNHAVNIVGYDNTGAKHFWIMRNSWGTGWGENGYARFEKNANKNDQGAFGCQMDSVYATVTFNASQDDPDWESLKKTGEQSKDE